MTGLLAPLPSIGDALTRLDPDNRTANQWVRQELDKDIYGGGASLVERLWTSLLNWSADHLRGGGATEGPSDVVNVVVALVVALALGGLIYLLVTRVRRRSTLSERSQRTVLGGTTGTAADHRAAAAAALARSDWDTAVVESARAIARDGDERTLLTGAESLTAHEVGTRLAPYFPARAEGLARAMDAFDAVAYGSRPATRAIAQDVRDTDLAVHRARPVRADEALEPVPVDSWSVAP